MNRLDAWKRRVCGALKPERIANGMIKMYRIGLVGAPLVGAGFGGASYRRNLDAQADFVEGALLGAAAGCVLGFTWPVVGPIVGAGYVGHRVATRKTTGI